MLSETFGTNEAFGRYKIERVFVRLTPRIFSSAIKNFVGGTVNFKEFICQSLKNVEKLKGVQSRKISEHGSVCSICGAFRNI